MSRASLRNRVAISKPVRTSAATTNGKSPGMTKRTRVLSGEAARKYFRALFQADCELSAETANRLADTCIREISELRVRTPRPVFSVPTATAARAPAAVPHNPTAASAPAPKAQAAADTIAATSVAVPDELPKQPLTPPQPQAFDPHAFSLIVTLRREGREALLAKLRAVGDTARLVEIAKAQHVGIPALKGDGASVLEDWDALCLAILAGTERRLAHREAAAS